MTDPCPPLALAGRQRKGLELAHGVGVPEHIVIDAGHQAGKRLRDYAFFDDPGRSAQRAADRMRPALGARGAGGRARRRRCASCAISACSPPAFLDAHLDPAPLPPQRAIEVTDVVTIESRRLRVRASRARPAVRRAARGTLLARDGPRDIRTPYDDCVLIMPTRRPRKGETAVRSGASSTSGRARARRTSSAAATSRSTAARTGASGAMSITTAPSQVGAQTSPRRGVRSARRRRRADGRSDCDSRRERSPRRGATAATNAGVDDVREP